MSIELINAILEKKWKELDMVDSKERLKEVVLNLDAISDFDAEYNHFLDEIEEKNMPEEEADKLMHSVLEKWTFIFASILNLDINNPFILSYMFESLIEIEDEILEIEDEDEEE